MSIFYGLGLVISSLLATSLSINVNVSLPENVASIAQQIFYVPPCSDGLSITVNTSLPVDKNGNTIWPSTDPNIDYGGTNHSGVVPICTNGYYGSVLSYRESLYSLNKDFLVKVSKYCQLVVHKLINNVYQPVWCGGLKRQEPTYCNLAIKYGQLVLDALIYSEPDVIIANFLGGYVMGIDNGLFYVSDKSLCQGGRKVFEHNMTRSYC